MYSTQFETIKAARKAHRCTWCGQQIEVGETYLRWVSYDGGQASGSKMHPECREACADECREYGEDEYLPYYNERPTRAAASIGKER